MRSARRAKQTPKCTNPPPLWEGNAKKRINLPPPSVRQRVKSLSKPHPCSMLSRDGGLQWRVHKVKVNTGSSKSIWGYKVRFDGVEVSSLFYWGQEVLNLWVSCAYLGHVLGKCVWLSVTFLKDTEGFYFWIDFFKHVCLRHINFIVPGQWNDWCQRNSDVFNVR